MMYNDGVHTRQIWAVGINNSERCESQAKTENMRNAKG